MGAGYDGMMNVPSGSFQQMQASEKHTCGVMTDGSVSCWGAHVPGALSPPAVELVQVSVQSDHACGIRPDGTLICWGGNTTVTEEDEEDALFSFPF